MENATYLFRERRESHNDDFRHSESRWSAIAQMAFIWLSKQSDSKFLNVYKSQYKIDSSNWLKINNKNSKLNLNNWKVSNSIVEGNISELFKSEPNFPDDKRYILGKKPDLILINTDEKNNTNIIIVEVKTVGMGVKNNIKDYRDIVKLVDSLPGYTCSLYYLMSYGHENSSVDWEALEDDKANIVLWEDLFFEMENNMCPLLEYIVDSENKGKWQKYIGDWQKFIDGRFTNR